MYNNYIIYNAILFLVKKGDKNISLFEQIFLFSFVLLKILYIERPPDIIAKLVKAIGFSRNLKCFGFLLGNEIVF